MIVAAPAINLGAIFLAADQKFGSGTGMVLTDAVYRTNNADM